MLVGLSIALSACAAPKAPPGSFPCDTVTVLSDRPSPLLVPDLDCLQGTNFHCGPWQDPGKRSRIRTTCYGRSIAKGSLREYLQGPECQSELYRLDWVASTVEVEEDSCRIVFLGPAPR